MCMCVCVCACACKNLNYIFYDNTAEHTKPKQPLTVSSRDACP